MNVFEKRASGGRQPASSCKSSKTVEIVGQKLRNFVESKFRKIVVRHKYICLLVGTSILAVYGGTYYYLWLAPHDGFDTPTRTIALSTEDLEIYEAVIRYQIFNSAAGGRGTSPAFVVICDQNPPEALLERFEGHSPPVDAAKRYRGRISVLYILDSIHRPSADVAIVTGGYYEGSLSASGNTYHLIRKNGFWKVVRDEMHWIS